MKQPTEKTASKKTTKTASNNKETQDATKAKKVGYFKGAWQELQLVRWPDRRASWSLTLAVILFSLFFAGLILGLDYIFENLFRKVIL